MRKLKKLFNNLYSFDKYFLEIFYRLKDKTCSKRILLLNFLIKKKSQCLNTEYLDEFGKAFHALAKNKRCLRLGMKYLLLFRILSPLINKALARIIYKRNFLLFNECIGYGKLVVLDAGLNACRARSSLCVKGMEYKN
ncbi:hypothetical protein BZG02_20000 [Labilibaculum filiforme]|uniref:Uncharacterized protein n=1 Tax=Labilibaculum filiforme TaxID=1940526 RepID=A0A2N3HQE5_9BACT|nr:hypothetical protein [Labilibaculum filiforme]PKQ60284.1 hypothetical protein BZG02_20000 [Labilibaculum filiforme]